jgi:hypothetical protein
MCGKKFMTSIHILTRWRVPALSLFVTGLALAACTPTARAEGVPGMAEQLASLRSEVEQLSDQLSDLQTEQRERVRSLARQKADLELERSREELKLKKLRTQLEAEREQIEAQASQSREFGPVFDAKAEVVRAYVKGSLPFRGEERLAALDKLVEQKQAGLIPAERAVSRLWSFIEDELRLTRESGLYKQTVAIDGDEHLVDVVRVGMVALYFRTADEEVGHTRKTDAGWTFARVDNAKDKARILDLFDQFKKQIRVGYFELPNALPVEQ